MPGAQPQHRWLAQRHSLVAMQAIGLALAEAATRPSFARGRYPVCAGAALNPQMTTGVALVRQAVLPQLTGDNSSAVG